MTTEEAVRMVAGECLVPINVAEIAIERCGTVRDAIAHLSIQRDPKGWRRNFYGD